jgi:hypothetical protein
MEPKRLVRARFTRQEDRALYELAGGRGTLRWTEVAKGLPGRNARQCRDRWNHYLAVPPSERPWTSEEDLLLTRAIAVHSKRWPVIAKLFAGRTDSEVYRRWIFRSATQDPAAAAPEARECAQTAPPPEVNPPDVNPLDIAPDALIEWQVEETSITKYYD